MGFVHLHLHTEYSLLDGAIRLRELFPSLQRMGMGAVAMTDHGNLFGMVEFYTLARQHGVKPILGCEVYVSRDHRSREPKETLHHLVLLAQDMTGYHNLLKLVSRSYLEGFYYKPRVDRELLAEHAKGLIALSACLHGEIPSLILQGDEESALRMAGELAERFPEGFYLEVQQNGLEEQGRVNEGLLRIARRTGIPVVATNDCHYLHPEDAKAHEVLLAVQTGKTLSSPDRLRFNTDQLYLRSPEEMQRLFTDLPQALRATEEIAERCTVELPLGQLRFPRFPVPSGQSGEEYLRRRASEGLERVLETKSPQEQRRYRERLEAELEVICSLGFADYFLVVADVVAFARRQGIPVGPGRGSAAGSLVAYALGITQVDPLSLGLLFERFLNPERITPPDIDVDFCMERRDEVIQYVAERYGRERVAQIITFGRMMARAVVRDVGRAMGLPYKEVDRIAKQVPAAGVSLAQAIKDASLQRLVKDDPRVAELLQTAVALEGLPRHASTHAAGVVISDRPLSEYIPLYRGTQGEVITQFDMESLEKVGLIKFDFLGLKTLTVMSKALQLVRTQGVELDLEHIPLDDSKTYELLGRGDTEGVFQLESSGMKDLLVRMKPREFKDLVALLALYRPGPLGSGMVEEFIQRRQGKVTVEYELPQLREALEDTYGVILYQEQVMNIASLLADYSLGEADLLRRAMGKKKPEVMAQQRERFLEGARRKGIDPDKAGRIFDHMSQFAEYGFNKSHSAAYAMIAYQTAYLKAHYPVEFMAALLSCEMSNTDKVIRHLASCRQMGIEILPPDVNESERDFTVRGGRIRFGLAAVKHVGEAAIESILRARAHGPFRSLFDFCRRVDLRKVNRRVIESLIKSGAFDSMGKRSQLLAALGEAMQRSQDSQRRRQMALFNQGERSSEELPDLEEWSEGERLACEKEALGFYITGHPLSKYEDDLRRCADTDTSGLTEWDGREVRIAGMVRSLKEINTRRRGDRMAFLTLEDLQGSVEVVVFADLYRECLPLVQSEEPILVVGTVEVDEDKPKLVASQIFPLSQAPLRAHAVHLFLEIPRTARRKLWDLREVLREYQGNCEAFVHLVLPDRYEAVVRCGIRVNPTVSLKRRLEQLLGPEAMRTR